MLLLALQGVCALACAPAMAVTIENTASVSYRSGSLTDPGAITTITSNTVRFETVVAPALTPAVIKFWRQVGAEPENSRLLAEESAQVVAINIDGGYLVSSGGALIPLPRVIGIDGTPIDKTVIASIQTSRYYPGEPVIVTLEDHDRNEDPRVREYVEVDIGTTSGDYEHLRIQETDVDTGLFATVLQSVAMPPAANQLNTQLSISGNVVVTADYEDATFPEEVVQDMADVVPAPPQARQVLSLQKQVSVAIAAVGDLLQYRLSLENKHVSTALATVIADTLPPGMRYRNGSLRIGGRPAPDPIVGSDGRTLAIEIGSLAPAAKIEISYLLEVVANAAPGQAINRAVANAGGGLVSNEAKAAVTIRAPLFTSRFTIIGRVLEGDCGIAGEKLTGVNNVRLLLDDGTYVTTDQDGAYHFEGVRPGTHVVQLDLDTLPPNLEAVPCNDNTRFAGRAFSQFVEAGGGSLWRADFRVREKASTKGEVGIRLGMTPDGDGLRYRIDLDGTTVAVHKLRAMAQWPEGMAFVPGSATLDGQAIADPQITGNLAIFALADPGMDWQRRIEFALDGDSACPTDGYAGKAVGLFDDSGGKPGRTPPAEMRLSCAPAPEPGDSGRTTASVLADPAASKAALPFSEQRQKRDDSLASAAAAEAKTDWLTGQSAGTQWLFPGEDYNPASPVLRVVIKHAPEQKVVLTVNGASVSPLSFDGKRTSADKTVSVSAWRGLPLVDGDNLLQAQILDKAGAVVATLNRTVHYANKAARAVLVPEQSILVADGIHNPVIAVRMLDRSGHPVRTGVSGEYRLDAPYLPAQTVQAQQERQLAGLDGFKPSWNVVGSDGIAYIELAPTTVAGSAQLNFTFDDAGSSRDDQIQVWLESTPRDWIVVGFAKGTVGYDTLTGNMQALEDQGAESGLTTDGQLSLYAKGRVAGEWMLTLAYDSDKPTDRLHDQSLLSTIDPNQFYTLYGDTTQQGYDAASADKVYLKLERDQFYALFGDYQTGLDQTELSRYGRTLNGVKVEYRGPVVEVNAFAAQTSQNFARDEIKGNGTSGLYRLSRNNIVINSESIKIETRDRFRSQIIIETRTLVRHIDYDIDYSAGTLFFREPINSKDFDFNPIFIVAEYETFGNGEEYFNAGGRVGVKLMEGRLSGGVTYLHDESSQGNSQLAGLDVKYQLAPSTEVRAEVATSEGSFGALENSGSAYLVELEHHGERLDVLAYVRRQDAGFGLNQQNAGESGTFKVGADVQWRVNDNFSLQGQGWHQENLISGATRDAIDAQLEYRADVWGASAGVRLVRDQALDGRVAESRQLTLGANRSFLGNKLGLNAQLDLGLGGKNESVDFPTRLQLGATYALNDAVRLTVAQEFTDGKDRDTSTTRVGFEVVPWKGATLTSTLNQSQISEYGPRTFALFGLNQKFLVGKHWSFDLSTDASHAFNESGEAPLVVDSEQTIAPGGIRDGGALTDDFTAVSAGATYRSELWSWNGRIEGRDGGSSDRYGFTTGFLRQIDTGIAFAASAQAFSVMQSSGTQALLANVSLSWAWRPLGSQWSLLNRLELRVDEMDNGAGSAVIGQDTLAVSGDAKSRRIVNNFVINHVAEEWTEDDMNDNLFESGQRSQWSLYYGSKYVFNRYDDTDFAGYTDILGVEWRYDLSPKLDIGLRASVRHSWRQHNYSYAFGPTVGFSPFANAWFSVGYNVIGFEDRDFDAAHYTRQGAYLMLRFKFDQATPGLSNVLSAVGGED